MQKCFIEKFNSTKLNEHLGGFGLDWLLRVECLFTCGLPPRIKGTNVSLSEVAYRAAISHMGSG